MKADPDDSSNRLRDLIQLLKERLAKYLSATKQTSRKDAGRDRAARSQKR
jgi:hypothetical protein